MNASQIELALWFGRRNSSAIVLPRFTPAGWWECDLWCVSRAGYATEIEIKLTVADYRRDAAKTSLMRDPNGGIRRPTSKHQLLAAGDQRCPSRFYFAMPADLVPLEEIPAWAGVIWAKFGKYGDVILKTARHAPRIHSEPARPEAIQQAWKACYWRFWDEKRTVRNLCSELSKVRKTQEVS